MESDLPLRRCPRRYLYPIRRCLYLYIVQATDFAPASFLVHICHGPKPFPETFYAAKVLINCFIVALVYFNFSK